MDQGAYLLADIRDRIARLKRIAGQIEAKASDLDAYYRAGGHASNPGLLTMQEWQEFAVKKTLQAVDGNKRKAARILSINEKTIYKYLKRIEHRVKF